ncbi:MAG TPA: hypothetical protein VFB60_06900 [Ktedonobacteraceae bacterium]|nr:hypothetical protein [Ktedonobacteraceae bacterium]
MGIVLVVAFLAAVAWVLDGLRLRGWLFWVCWIAYGLVVGGAVIAFVSGMFRV